MKHVLPIALATSFLVIGGLAIALMAVPAPLSTAQPAPISNTAPATDAAPAADAPPAAEAAPATDAIPAALISTASATDTLTTTAATGASVATGTVTATVVASSTSVTPTVTASPPGPADQGVVSAVDLSSLRSIDLRFRPKPNGYAFRNYGGVEPGDFTITDTRRMFGDFAVCLEPGNACVPKLAAQEWAVWANSLAQYGHCDGFTTTGLRFYKTIDQLGNFRSRARNAFTLKKDDIRRQIAYFWILQIPDPIATLRSRSLRQAPNQVLSLLYDAMSGAAPDPTTLLVYKNAERTSGHSVTPYALEKRGKGIWRVRVYDSNWPNDRNRYVVVDTNANTWSYNLGPGLGIWRGDESTHSLGAIPISAYTQAPVCPWCRADVLDVSLTHALASNDSASELRVTDSSGRALGIDEGKLSEEIPEALRVVLPGGLGLPDTAVYYLPVTDTYTLSLSRRAGSTSDEPSEIVEFGPGYAVSVSDITLPDRQSSQLVVAAEGGQVVYRSAIDDRVTLNVIVEGAAESNKFVVEGLALGGGRAVTLTADAAGGRLVLDNSRNISGTYDLTFVRNTPSGQQIFTATGIVLNAADTQVVNYGAWNGAGPMILSVDAGSQGAVTQTYSIGGVVDRVFVPFVTNGEPVVP